MHTVFLAGCKDISDIIQEAFPQECSIQMVPDIPAVLKRMQGKPADLVILDMELPTSQEVIASLQTLAKKSTFLFVGDQTLFDSAHPMTVVPALDYLLRPFSPKELILNLEMAFYACEQRKQAAETVSDESLRLSLVRERIETYIQQHYSENLSMQMVAHAMNYSDTHFCRLFKQCFKVNFSVYLNEFRIAHAKQMLVSSNRNIKEIALGCGYQDTSYFIRVFKRLTNMTPADYRIYMQAMSRK